MLAVLAMLEVFDRRNVPALGGAGRRVGRDLRRLGLLWMGIRGDYRRDYVRDGQFSGLAQRAHHRASSDLTSDVHQSDTDSLLKTTDTLVDRMWTIYYPALAAEARAVECCRTPTARSSAPRCCTSSRRASSSRTRRELPSDSDDGPQVLQRRWSPGARPAPASRSATRPSRTSTSACPGCSCRSSSIGILIGPATRCSATLIWHRELFVAFATVTFWLSVYLFERSWATMLGVTVGFMVYLGVPIVLLDRFLLIQFAAKQRRPMTRACCSTPAEHASVLTRCACCTSRPISRRRGRTAVRRRPSSGSARVCSAPASTSRW